MLSLQPMAVAMAHCLASRCTACKTVALILRALSGGLIDSGGMTAVPMDDEWARAKVRALLAQALRTLAAELMLAALLVERSA